MKPVMTENKREELLDLHGKIDDAIATLMHELEEDELVTGRTWRMCEANYSRISRVLREMYEEIYYS
jgi:hypothetical protein